MHVRVRMLQGAVNEDDADATDGDQTPVYRSTAQQPHARYAETLAAIQMQQ